MSKEERKVPELRFKGFHDDWEQRKFSEVFTKLKSYPLSRNVETTTQTGTKYIHYGDIHTKKAQKINNNSNIPYIENKQYELLEKGDIILADASEDYQGIAEPAVIVENTDFKIVAGLHTIALRSNNSIPLYLYYLIKSSSFRMHGYRTGTGMKVFGITADNVLKFETCYPRLEEQLKISKTLDNMDQLITLHQRKINRLNLLKKEYLNANLRYINKRKIKIRFSGFQKPWKNKKLKKLSPLRGGYAFKSNEFEKTGIPIIRISNILSGGHVGGGFAYYKEQDNDDKYTLPDNAVVLAMSGATTGKVAVLRKDKDIKFYQNQRVGYFTPIDGINYAFISTLVSSPLFRRQLNSVLVAGAQPNVSPKDIDNFEFYIPEEIEEQRKIGLFFKRIDKIIVLHQEKLNIIEKFKKQILNKMFI